MYFFLCLLPCSHSVARLRRTNRLGHTESKTSDQILDSHRCAKDEIHLIGSRFYYSIHLGCQRSFNVSIGLDEASCPGRWSRPNFLAFLSSSSATYRALRCLTKLASYYVQLRRTSTCTRRKLTRGSRMTIDPRKRVLYGLGVCAHVWFGGGR